jgi:hypothetical protein
MRTLKTLNQLYPPKFVPIIVANTSMSKGSKLNKSTMGKQIKDNSNNLLTMPMDEQQPCWPLLHLLNPRE